MALLLVVSAGIVLAGVFWYDGFAGHYRREVERQLSAIAELKVDDLMRFRQERLGDARLLFRNGEFRDLVRRFVQAPGDLDARGRLQAWLEQYPDAYHYSRASLLDPRGVSLLSTSSGQDWGATSLIVRSVPAVLQAGQPQFLDFFRDAAEDPPALALLIPIIDDRVPPNPMAVVALGIDPAAVLYPFLSRWPVPSPTAETLLVRRDGADVLFLSPLRFDPDAAVERRASLASTRTPAVQAALGYEGIFEGIDYRGGNVLSALRTIPDSPWHLVARIDQSEFQAPLQERLVVTVAVVVALLLSLASMLWVAWRRQRLHHFRQLADTALALQASDRELKARNAELLRFTYAVSHDLRSPVVTIKSFVGFLERDLAANDAERVAKDIGFIRNAGDKMGRLLDELLELARVGHSLHPPVEMSLQSLVADAVALVAGRIATRETEVVVTRDTWLVTGDRERLVEVFQNLLDNAVKFMGGQPLPRVEIGVESTGPQPVIFVRDNGVGVDVRHQSKLFGLFEKLDPRVEGTGIGLALVRRIIELHGGRVWLESAGIGQGTTFRFTLAGTRRADA
jgi:signal transduction histidine kinase